MDRRNLQLLRVLTLLRVLSASRNGVAVSHLANALDNEGISVSKRTIYRDLNALEQIGLAEPVSDEAGISTGVWRSGVNSIGVPQTALKAA